MAITIAGLMLVGMYEFFFGIAGPGIWIAIGGEALFLSLYLLVLSKGLEHQKGRLDIHSKHKDA